MLWIDFKTFFKQPTGSNDYIYICDKFDWVFVDHSHESFYMDRTIMLLSKCVAEDHLILLHDMHLQGVQQQSYKFANLTRIRNLGIGTLW